MIWFAWRQFRIQALIAGTLLVALGICFLVTGPGLAHYYNTVVAGCAAHGDCNGVTSSFLSRYPFFQNLLTESVLLPVLIGIFWGAPVVAREFDAGTYRLAWTQSAMRTRWLAAKIFVGATASVVTAGLFTLMGTWWSSPLDRVRDMPFSLFDTRDIAPIGYALFAFALGVAIGALVRRTIPTMVLTIVGFAAVRLCFNQYIRPHFASALHSVTKFQLPVGNGGSVSMKLGQNPADWTLSQIVRNAAGKISQTLSNHNINFQLNRNGSTSLVGVGRCPNKIPSGIPRGQNSGPTKAVQEALSKCVSSFHLTNYLTYQPASRFWMFQWYELASYVVLSALLTWFSVWWIRRR
jgi:hypothetical protein